MQIFTFSNVVQQYENPKSKTNNKLECIFGFYLKSVWIEKVAKG